MSRFILLGIGLLSLTGFILLALSYESRFIMWIDEWLIFHIQRRESAVLTDWMEFISSIGTLRFVSLLVIVVSVFLLVIKHRPEILIVALSVYGASFLNRLLKLLFERARPDIHPIIVEAGYSFPSGHSMNAFTFYGIVTFLLWRLIPSLVGRTLLIGISLFMILTIGLSRVYLGVHFPSDVMAAYLESCTLLIIVIFVAPLKKSLK